MPYDPINDEQKLFTLREWTEVFKAELDLHLKEWENKNAFFQEPHTWREWLNSFIRYMSW